MQVLSSTIRSGSSFLETAAYTILGGALTVAGSRFAGDSRRIEARNSNGSNLPDSDGWYQQVRGGYCESYSRDEEASTSRPRRVDADDGSNITFWKLR